jgi:hypothetical protein
MKKLLTVVICLLFIKVGIAQTIPTFNKIYSDTGVLSGGVNITSLNDSIYFSIYTQDTSSSYQYIDFIKTAPNGTEAARLKVKRPGYSYSPGYTGSLRMTSDGYLICGGNSGPLTGVGSGTFFKIDRSALDTLYVKYYRNPGEGADFFGFGELSDGNYLFAGREGDSTSPEGYDSAWMVKTDTGGNELWQKSMVSDVYNSAVFVSPFQGGYYQWWATAQPITLSGNPADSAIFVDRYDNNGNLEWRDTFGIVGNDNTAGPFTGLKDGGGIIIVNILDTTGFQYGPMTFSKFDSNGVILWRHYISQPTQLSSITETRSGSIVACGGGAGYPIGVNGDTANRYRGDIIKFDKNGNVVFYQVYEYDTLGYDGLADITETSDGGYACVGNAFHPVGSQYVQAAWLLKVDSNGCLNGDCPTLYTGIKDIPSLEEFFVFPNPASSQFTVALAGPNDIYQYHDLKFSLYDLTGRLVTEQLITAQTTIIQRGDLSNGLYIWSLSDEANQLRNGKMVFK